MKKTNKKIKSGLSPSQVKYFTEALKEHHGKKKIAAPLSDTKMLAKQGTPKAKAVVQKQTFEIVSKDRKHSVRVDVLMIDDIAIYDDKSFRNLSKAAAADVERILDAKIAKHLGYDALVNVTQF